MRELERDSNSKGFGSGRRGLCDDFLDFPMIRIGLWGI